MYILEVDYPKEGWSPIVGGVFDTLSEAKKAGEPFKERHAVRFSDERFVMSNPRLRYLYHLRIHGIPQR